MKENESLSSIIKQLTDRKYTKDANIGGFDIDSHVSSIDRLPSKKNKVYRINMINDRALILKISATSRAINEFNVLTEAYNLGLDVPQPYIIRKKLIFMEFVDGSNVCDALNSTLDKTYSVRLAEWLLKFHNAFRKKDRTLVKSDAILKNFIETENRIVGVDFEFAHYGNPVEDLGELCAHILDTDPMFTQDKYDLCNALIKTYSSVTEFNLSNVAESVASALETAAKYRLNQRSLLIAKASELRTGNTTWLQDFNH